MVKFIFLIGIIISFNSCKSDFLFLKKKQNYADIRLQGYYYNEFNSDEPRIDIYFLYSNGVVIYGESPSLRNLNQHLEDVKSGKFYQRISKNKTGWEIFYIEKSNIFLETWEPSSGGRLKTVVRSGKLLNDSSFEINQLKNNYTGKTVIINENYYFQEFYPKPDSTNIFIK